MLIRTRVATVGDYGYERIHDGRSYVALWRDFDKMTAAGFGETRLRTLLFHDSSGGRPEPFMLSVPTEAIGVDNKTMLLDIASRIERRAWEV